MQLTPRDRAILVALTQKVRLLSLDQIHRTWWPTATPDTARRRLEALSTLVTRMTLNAHPELTLAGPLFTWQPGRPTPPFGALSYRLKKRWNEAPHPTPVYIASPVAARYFGGFGGKLRRPLQATHDLHVSQVYLRLLIQDPDQAALWVSEERFAPERRREKLPDAVLRDPSGRLLRVIEFGGSYDAAHVARVHQDCVTRALPYELW